MMLDRVETDFFAKTENNALQAIGNHAGGSDKSNTPGVGASRTRTSSNEPRPGSGLSLECKAT